uniref:Protein GLE1 n=1 Tax=Rhizophora mucronata TaxID=61149 RepID=A0A2P2KI12_RHIMU
MIPLDSSYVFIKCFCNLALILSVKFSFHFSPCFSVLLNLGNCRGRLFIFTK